MTDDTTETLTRLDVLLSMPEQDRYDALADELFYGTFYAEKTDDGFRRLDPLEQDD